MIECGVLIIIICGVFVAEGVVDKRPTYKQVLVK